MLQNNIEKAKMKLEALKKTSDEDREPLKGSVESWFDLTKSAFGDLKTKLKA
jgi:hypothetical protein